MCQEFNLDTRNFGRASVRLWSIKADELSQSHPPKKHDPNERSSDSGLEQHIVQIEPLAAPKIQLVRGLRPGSRKIHHCVVKRTDEGGVHLG